MARRETGGVYGPYPHGDRWRIVVRDDGGGQVAQSYATKEAAEEVAREARRRRLNGARTVATTIDEYEQHLIAKGNKPRSYKATLYRLQLFFTDKAAPPAVRALIDVSPAWCAARYEKLCADYAVDSHRNFLAETRTFLKWCKSRKWISRNPLDGVVGLGKRHHGKEQLRIDEARRWLGVAEALALTKPGAAAALCAALMGMRADEIVSRLVRDLDDGGRVLWIPDSKTEAGRRTLEVPEELRPILGALAEGKEGSALLFGRHWRDWPNEWVQKICATAKVPKVTAHGMRGLHSTLQVLRVAMPTEGKSRALPEVLAALAGEMGHVEQSTTRRSYIAPGTVEAVGQRQVMKVLRGGKG